MTDTEKSEAVSTIIMVLIGVICILGIIILILYVIPSLWQAYPKPTMIPCEKIVVVTEKYSRISERGIEYWIIIERGGSKYDLRISDGFYSSNGLYEKIPLNTTVTLYGVDSRITEASEVKNITKVTESGCVNCCMVEYVK